MLASLLIIGFSLALLVYWFRYSCILLLRNSPLGAAPDSFLTQAHQHLGSAELDPLHRALQRDYQVLTYLLEHAAGLELDSAGDHILGWDYKVMRWWYRLTKSAFPDQARQALLEMAAVLTILAQKISQQAGSRIEA